MSQRLFGPEPLKYWPYDLTAFAMLVVVVALQRAGLYDSALGGAVVTLLTDPLVLLGALMLRPQLIRRVRDLPKGRALIRAGLLCGTAGFIVVVWAKVVTTVTGWHVPTWGGLQQWLMPLGWYTAVLSTWTVVHFWVAAEGAKREEQQRAAAAQADAAKSELQHLRQQLDPHFLFNALNGIAAEIRTKPDAAVAMVRELADFLRYSLDHRDKMVSPFGAELDAVNAYLEVQKARFGPELRFRLHADEATRRLQAPSFLLQPLVENAVKHALKAGVMPIDIVVDSMSDGGTLRIDIANSGTLSADWATAGDPGVGLSVLRRRLDLHYRDRYAFDMRQTGQMVTATLVLRGEPCSA